MDFSVETIKTEKEVDFSEIFNGHCPFCNSKDVKKRSCHNRNVQELGTPFEKVVVFLTIRTYECQLCKSQFTPEHPLYPPKYEVTKAVLKYALTRYNYNNSSGNEIARDLALLHNVEVSEQTVYKWLKDLSHDLVKARLNKDKNDLPQNVQAISVDGTYTNIAKDIIGKKKGVESLSVTKLDDGRFLLMWWE